MLLLNKDLKKQTTDNIRKILDYFEVHYRVVGQRIVMSCPIHGGDNESGLCIFLDGQTVSGNWKCWTNSCEDIYGYGIIGFVRGLLSKDGLISIDNTLVWLEEFFNNNSPQVPDGIFQPVTQVIQRPMAEITKMQFRSQVSIPAKYYLERGYKRETMNKFDVGLCLNKKNTFYMRIVIPVYDEFGYNVIGQVARSPNEQCSKCKTYHFSNKSCPTNGLEKYWAEKWLNSRGFSKSVTLYNIWNASKFIQKTKQAVLVEGQGDVWRLDEAGIYNAVGMFGIELSGKQVALLDSLQTEELVLLTDNDKAGIEAKNKISFKYRNKYKIRHIPFKTKDIGDMTIEQVNQEIKPFIERKV